MRREPVIKENDSWYTNQEEVLEEGVAGHREKTILLYMKTVLK